METINKINVVCLCGSIIPDEEIIDCGQGTTEEGEEYSVIEAICPNCKKEYEYTEWISEWKDFEEIKEFFNDHIHNPNYYNSKTSN